MKKLLGLLFIFIVSISYGQNPFGEIQNRVGGIGNSTRNSGNSTINSSSKDSTKKKNNNKLDTLGFEHRDDLADSISISYRYMDSLRRNPIDSSVNDFDKYYPLPAAYQNLGNNGAAAFSLIYKPFAKAGWDEGFHSFDIYRYKLSDTKFYKTTGPFTMLGYQLAGGKEQMVQALHTQSPRQNINFGFDYRLINAPGAFVSQNTNHNNARFFSTYQSKRKRYNSSFVYISNVLKASENGGIVDDALLLDPNKKSRFSVPVRLSNRGLGPPNPFATNVVTGNTSRERILFLRNSYDIGKRDSIAINDSTTEYLFYPKLRFQHTLIISANEYQFKDLKIDTNFYKLNYAINNLTTADTFLLAEKWNKVSNDFTLTTFPDTKNPSQFLSAGITVENINGTVKNNTYSFYNLFAHGEYRNRTKNKLWDLLLKGELYINGFNAGNFNVQSSISRNLGAKLGYVNLYFNNVNRTPSFVYDKRSAFNLGNTGNYKNENIISFGASSTNKILTLGFNNYLITNLAFFKNFYQTEQYNKPINVVQFSASKKIRLKKYWYYYADAVVQFVNNAAPINLPFIFTRSRISYEKTAYKNLKLSAGIEVRYYTPYKANDYSPLLSQFTTQENITIKNKPDAALFFNFKIKGFTTYIRMENVNTITFQNGFGFKDNNFASPHYPTQGRTLRLGIRWWFVK